MIEITTIIEIITNIDIIFTFDNLSIISILTTTLHSILFKSIKKFFIIDSIKISIFIYSFTLELNARSIASLFNLKFPFNLYLLLLNRKFELCISSFLTFSFQIETTGVVWKHAVSFPFFESKGKYFLKTRHRERIERWVREREREGIYESVRWQSVFRSSQRDKISLSLSLSRLIVREGEEDIGPVING